MKFVTFLGITAGIFFVLVFTSFNSANYESSPEDIGELLEKQLISRADDVCYFGWADYIGSLQQENNEATINPGLTLFPDSSVYHGRNEFVEKVYNRAAGYVFTPDYVYGNPTSYSVDSLRFHYYYTRNYHDKNVVDTIVFTMFSNEHKENFESAQVVDQTLPNTGIDYTYPLFNNGSVTTADSVTIIKIPLNENNVTLGESPSSISVDIPERQILGTHILQSQESITPLGIIVEFIPGFAYTPGDNITITGNEFSLASLDQNGYSYKPSLNYNGPISSVLTTDPLVVGQENQGRYTPLFDLPSAKYIEHYMISLYVEACHVGTSEYYLEQEISVYPVPATTELNFKSNRRWDVSLKIVDAKGRVVRFEQISINGDYKLDVSNLKRGSYSLILNAGDRAMTKEISIL